MTAALRTLLGRSLYCSWAKENSIDGIEEVLFIPINGYKIYLVS